MNRQASNFGGDGSLREEYIKYGKPFSIRLNDEEKKELEQFMDMADLPNQSTAAKILMKIGLSVIHTHFSDPKVAVLFKKERSRN